MNNWLIIFNQKDYAGLMVVIFIVPNPHLPNIFYGWLQGCPHTACTDWSESVLPLGHTVLLPEPTLMSYAVWSKFLRLPDNCQLNLGFWTSIPIGSLRFSVSRFWTFTCAKVDKTNKQEANTKRLIFLILANFWFLESISYEKHPK